MSKLRALSVAVLLSATASSAIALGTIPNPDRDGSVATPAPIAGAGLAWLGILAAGGYLVYLFRRRG
jgi:hypothetical protein